MREVSRIRRNSLSSFLSTLTRILATMLMFVGIARLYGPVAFGQFSLAHTYLILFYILADFGTDMLVAIEVARQRERTSEIIQEFAPLKLMTSLITMGAMYVVAMLFVGGQTRVLMLILCLGILGNSGTTFLFALFKGNEQLSFETFASFWQNLFLLLGLILLGSMNASLITVAVLFVVSRFAGFFILLPKATKSFDLGSFQFRFDRWKQALRGGLPYGLHMLFGTLFFQLDTILLALWRGDLAVGMYQAVMRIVIIVLVVPDIIVSAVLPTLAKLHVDDEKRWKEMGRLLAKTLMYFGLPFGVIFFVYADQVISLAYGSSRFTESIPVLRLFALIVVIRYAGEAYALLLTTSQQQSKRTATTIASTVLNVVLNAYAIPRYGIEGAAGVSLITNVFAVFAYVFLLDPRFHLPVVRIDFRQWLVVALTATFATLLWNFGHHLVALELGLMVGFFLIMYLFVGFSPEEKSLIFAMRQQVA